MFEEGDTVKITQAADETNTAFIGQTGIVFGIIRGFVTTESEQYLPLYRVRFTNNQRTLCYASELEKVG